MESDLRELVLGFLRSLDLVAVRIASMVVHEAMMDTALDFWDMGQYLLVDQARALARLNKLRKFKLVPALLLLGSSDKFRHSVRIEMLVASLLLALTAYLSTVVGPMMH